MSDAVDRSGKYPMTYFLTISCVVCGWAMLRLLGSERTLMMKAMESQLRREQPLVPPAQTAPDTTAPEKTSPGKTPVPGAAAPPKGKH
jgi:hypothetical protein